MKFFYILLGLISFLTISIVESARPSAKPTTAFPTSIPTSYAPTSSPTSFSPSQKPTAIPSSVPSSFAPTFRGTLYSTPGTYSLSVPLNAQFIYVNMAGAGNY